MSISAKKHPLLSTITAPLSGRLPETIVDVLGVKYRLRLLKPEAEDWVAMNTQGTTISAALLNLRKPTLAAALVSVSYRADDGHEEEIPVERLFELPADMEPKVREGLQTDAKLLRDWRREQILEWLREEVDTLVVSTLYDAYTAMLPKHKEVMKELSGFSTGTS